jgi:KUP system potassium uptake protein
LLIVLPLLPFIFIDFGFVATTSIKIISGGWVPLLVALVAFIVMGTWQQGRRRMMVTGRPFSSQARFANSLESRGVIRTQGTGAFLAGGTVGVPRYIDQLVRHTQALPERIVLITLVPLSVAHVEASRRTAATRLTHGFWRIRCRFGYLDEIDVSKVLEEAARHGLEVDVEKVVYYLRRWEVVITGKSRMAKWRSRLFAYCYRNSLSPTMIFNMPADRIVIVNSPLEI